MGGTSLLSSCVLKSFRCYPSPTVLRSKGEWANRTLTLTLFCLCPPLVQYAVRILHFRTKTGKIGNFHACPTYPPPYTEKEEMLLAVPEHTAGF